jgi:large subunit ribosomal protein L18
MNATEIKSVRRERRRLHVRNRVRRTDRARLSVHRSVAHTYAQIIDDATGRTLCGVGTTTKAYAADLAGKSKTDRAAFLGKEIARLALEKGVSTVVFDRGSSKYHGRVKALADAAREAGLKF